MSALIPLAKVAVSINWIGSIRWGGALLLNLELFILAKNTKNRLRNTASMHCKQCSIFKSFMRHVFRKAILL